MVVRGWVDKQNRRLDGWMGGLGEQMVECWVGKWREGGSVKRPEEWKDG